MFLNFQCNIGGLGGNIYNFASSAPARQIVLRIAASEPGLDEKIAALKPDLLGE